MERNLPILPVEIVNFIFYLANNGKEMYYNKKRKRYSIRYTSYYMDSLNKLYSNCKIYTRYWRLPNYTNIYETQVCFPPTVVHKPDSDVQNTICSYNSMVTTTEKYFVTERTKTIESIWNRYFMKEKLSNGSKYMFIGI
jgi:hypothetical protein